MTHYKTIWCMAACIGLLGGLLTAKVVFPPINYKAETLQCMEMLEEDHELIKLQEDSLQMCDDSLNAIMKKLCAMPELSGAPECNEERV